MSKLPIFFSPPIHWIATDLCEPFFFIYLNFLLFFFVACSLNKFTCVVVIKRRFRMQNIFSSQNDRFSFWHWNILCGSNEYTRAKSHRLKPPSRKFMPHNILRYVNRAEEKGDKTHTKKWVRIIIFISANRISLVLIFFLLVSFMIFFLILFWVICWKKQFFLPRFSISLVAIH